MKQKKNQPLVSVLISAHNEQNWIEQSVNSILTQTYSNLEIIIVNDGSTDDTLNILKKIQKKDKRVKIINQENKGLTKSLNIGINQCKGQYIARMDADNVSREDRIERQVEFLKKNPSYSIVGSWRKEIKNNEIKKKKFPVENKAIKQWLIRACVISHSSVMIKSEKIKKYKYNERFRTSQDYELWIRMAKKEKFHNIPEYLTTAYNRKKGITNSKKKKEAYKTKLKIHKKALENIKHPIYMKIWILKPFYELIK